MKKYFLAFVACVVLVAAAGDVVAQVPADETFSVGGFDVTVDRSTGETSLGASGVLESMVAIFMTIFAIGLLLFFFLAIARVSRGGAADESGGGLCDECGIGKPYSHLPGGQLVCYQCWYSAHQ